MQFLEAIKALNEGKHVTRVGWVPEDGYLVHMPDMRHIWHITTQPSVNAGNKLFTVEDFLADDWQVSNGANKEKEDEEQRDAA